MVYGSIEDGLGIRETYGRYALAVSHQDADAWLMCWSEDGRWKTPQFETQGQAGLRQCWDLTWTMFSRVSVFNELGAISFAGGSARLEAMVLEVIALPQGGVIRMIGRYADELVRSGGAWRFASRTYTLLTVDAPGPVTVG